MADNPSYLVMGGVGGIGEALARRLRKRDAQVTLTSRSLERAEELASEIGAKAAQLDIEDESAMEAAIAEASGENGLSGLAYCIGSIPLKPLNRTSADDLTEAFRLNVVGAFRAVRIATDALRAGQGSVVLFSSVAARQGFPNHAAIGTAKGAVEGLTLSLAADLAPDVRVNAVAPSLTQTPLAEPLTKSEKMSEAIAALHPLQRLGQADDMAALAAFLMSSDESGWITGQVFGVDGGRSSLRVGKA